MNKQHFIDSGCCTCDNRKILVLREKKCQYVFYNDNQFDICQVDIDGCMIKNGKRCDFLVIYPENSSVYFVELKGSDLFQAVDQINQSLNILLPYLNNTKINARIVLTKVSVPDIRNSSTLLKFEKRVKLLNGNFKIETIRATEKL